MMIGVKGVFVWSYMLNVAAFLAHVHVWRMADPRPQLSVQTPLNVTPL